MKQNSLLVISTYPSRGTNHDRGTIGIAPFTKNTVNSIKKHAKNLKISVLGEIKKGEKKSAYSEDGIEVKRVWKRNSFKTFFSLLWEIFTHQKDKKNVLMQFGFAVYGDLYYLLPLPLFLFLLRIMGKRVYFVFHEVVPNAHEIHGHMNIKKNSLKASLYTLLFKLFYWSVSHNVYKNIVLEDVLAKRLSKMVASHKITTIPIGAESFLNTESETKSREKLGIEKGSFVLLAFGFLAWYKGTDWIIDIVGKLKKNPDFKNMELIIAGGPNSNRIDKKYYNSYIAGIEKTCKKNGIRLTGFIEEEDIPLYFRAADLVVFPYRAFMGASAPITLAYSFSKPFLVSAQMRGILQASDLQKALSKANVSSEELYFRDEHEFQNKVMEFKKNRSLKKNASEISRMIAKSRNWDSIGGLYYEQLFK